MRLWIAHTTRWSVQHVGSQAAVRSARPIVQIAHIIRSMAQFLKVSIPYAFQRAVSIGCTGA
jgi:hypothetical protein